MQKIEAATRGNTCDTSVEFAGKETRDCTVRALASASGMHYDNAHALLKKHGRKNRCGAFFGTMLRAYNEAGFVLDSVHGTTGAARCAARISNRKADDGITLAKILPKLAFGEYIVNTTGHAVAVVNGKIIDTFDNPAGKRVVAVFKKIEKFGE
jgi:hypothetical protein